MIRFPVPLDADLAPVSEDDLRRYAVRTPRAIEAIFTAACTQRQPVALRGADNDRRAVGELSMVRPDEALILSGEDDDIEFMPLASQDEVDCVMVVDRVTVRFLARVRSLRIADGRLLIETEWPHLVLRRQRRENFRMSLSQGRPPMLGLPEGSAGEGPLFKVLDLSGGGLCLQIEEGVLDLNIGDVLRGCRLELNPIERLSLSLVIRSRERWTLPTGALGWRYGCAFENVSPHAEQLIRRYVIHAERQTLRSRMQQG
jgi:c-di-GMP-binding flagellar brake protein YcgR